ncbi:MAG: hypothetical protein JXR37_07600 [Kiritimatiellae bacterium]|nr:hypothetical protein [Kiritimatiellia bacterium]
MKRCIGLAVLGVGLAMIVPLGCRTMPRARGYTVTVNMSDSMADSAGMLPSVEVHIIALDSVKGRLLQSLSMGDYWNPNRKKDPYIKHVMHFGANHPKVQVLQHDDGVWRRWAATGAEHLFVLADLHGVFEDKEDVKDPRRLILPLDPARWKAREIQLVIEPNGVFCVTSRLPRAQ